MHNYLAIYCGKTVNSMGMIHSKTCSRPYTGTRISIYSIYLSKVKHILTHQLAHSFYRKYSTYTFRKLPLIEHYFYPLSTAPIITTTN